VYCQFSRLSSGLGVLHLMSEDDGRLECSGFGALSSELVTRSSVRLPSKESYERLEKIWMASNRP
jgi:hypothetical protein